MSEINQGAANGGQAAAGGAPAAQAAGANGASGGNAPATGAAASAITQAAGGTGGQGAGSPATGTESKWLDALSPEYKTDQSLQGFKTVEELAKSYLHAQKLVGAEKIPLPSKHATDQEWEQVFTKLGRPESADKYEFRLAEGHKPEDLKDFREAAFKAGMLPKQVEAMYAFDQARNKQVMEANKAHRENIVKEGLAKLKQEWGGKDGTEYTDKLQKAGMALNTIGPEFLEWADKCGVGDDPMFLKLMNKVSGMMAEDTLRGAGGAASFGESRASIQGKINEIMGNQKHAYWDRMHPNHKAAVEEVAGLQEMALRAK